MKSQQKYWDKKIAEWSAVSYEKGAKGSLVEIMATPFRGADKRVNIVSKLLASHVSGKTILFLGCGVGNECIDFLAHKPRKVIGIDISPVAIRVAKETAKKKGIEEKIAFMAKDVGTIKKLPDADFIIGLGFIDYLTPIELTNLFKLVSKRNYLFSFFEKKISLFNLIHEIYVKSQNCPGAFKYRRKEISTMMPKNSRHLFFKKDGMLFLTNIKRFVT